MNNPIDNNPRVSGGYSKGSQPGVTRGAERNDAGARAGAPSAATQPDTAGESTRLQAVRDAIDATPEVDASRVSDLRERISRGEYPLDAERIAERFADFERLLSDA